MDLPVRIDKHSGIPIYIQLGEQIRLLIREGTLARGEAMPTVRSLAVHLGINANTVARVYHQLQADGLLRLERGIGTFVAGASASHVGKFDFKRLEEQATELIRLGKRYGMSAAEVSQFIQTRWQEVDDVSSERQHCGGGDSGGDDRA